MRKLFEIGGFAATAVLVVFGVVAITMGVNGRSTVHNSLALEQISGTPDMNASRHRGGGEEGRPPGEHRAPDGQHRRQADQHRPAGP